MATTRLDVRRAVGDHTGDMLLLEANQNATDNTTIKEEVNLGGRRPGSPTIAGRELIISGGNPVENHGHIARVRTNGDGSLTFSPAAPLAVLSGQQIELWRERDQFGGISSLHRTINDAIDFAKNTAGPEVYLDTFVFNREAPTFTLPTTWAEFGHVEVFRDYGWTELPDAAVDVLPGTRTVQIMGVPANRYGDQTMRAYGYLRVQKVTNDTDPIEMDQSWLVEAVSSAMTLAVTRRLLDASGTERRAGYWSGQKQAQFPRIVLQRRGLGIRLP